MVIIQHSRERNTAINDSSQHHVERDHFHQSGSIRSWQGLRICCAESGVTNSAAAKWVMGSNSWIAEVMGSFLVRLRCFCCLHPQAGFLKYSGFLVGDGTVIVWFGVCLQTDWEPSGGFMVNGFSRASLISSG